MRNEHRDCGLETRHFYARPEVRLKAVLTLAWPGFLIILIFCFGQKAPYGWSPVLYFGTFFGISLGMLVWRMKRRRPLISIDDKTISFYPFPQSNPDYSLKFLWSELDQRHGLENGGLFLYGPISRFGRSDKLIVPIDKLEESDQKVVLELVKAYLAAKAEWTDCLACGEPIEPSLHRCPKCGWTWD